MPVDVVAANSRHNLVRETIFYLGFIDPILDGCHVLRALRVPPGQMVLCFPNVVWLLTSGRDVYASGFSYFLHVCRTFF